MSGHRSAQTLRNVVGPIWLELVTPDIGRPSYRAVQPSMPSPHRKDPADSNRALLGNPETRKALLATVLEALRPGVGGAVDDWASHARNPWGFAPEDINVPTA